ncbi:hypothetical protein LPB136_10815 [Tenacibaculum todarodis]|uniref:Glutamyl-tRNA synthetase n=1 Tax=Tenacibaculum todarodis TaxID=1850252 RepID=A0A1L3JL59_9FLAO|nr:DUF4175 family protein [Tenacibaculum todarodis]APG65824.1 hypothetical protein LPB136_10815 [Tenacibaculum todarodis]
MNGYEKIKEKLQQFSRKYYTNELIKGSILFVSLGLLYLLFTLFIEYFLWLKPTARTILFWVFIIIELALLIRFIFFPLFKLFGLQKGISEEESSKIIGNHFPEVSDKLLNILQLKNENNQSELLLASIDQKANELQPVVFTKAIDFQKNKKYLKYAIIPLLLFGLTFLTGTNGALTQSLERVVNHRTAYTPPAPFLFSLKNDALEVIQGKPFSVSIETVGKVLPAEAKIYFNNQEYYLQNKGGGLFSYTFSEINEDVNFYVEANGIQSENFTINVIKTPTIQQLKMHLSYPNYVGKRNETISNTGNITVPQGTVINWQVTTNQTDSITFLSENNKVYFDKKAENSFTYAKRIRQGINYQIATSNNNLKEYEKLQYSVAIIRDEHPTIAVKSNIDSISRGPVQFAGQIADDYGLRKLELVYYDEKNPQAQQTFKLPITKENIQNFFYQFPDGITLQSGIDYEFFFQVFDNDAVNGNKKTASKIFSYRKKTEEEVEDELLKEQKNTIDNLQNSLEKQRKNKKDLEKIQFDLQNKKNMNWNDQKKVQNLIKRQEQYQEMMQRQTDQLKENFDEKKEQNDQLQEKKQDLKERIEELKKIAKEKKLLDELQKMAEKLNKEELVKKSKELAQKNKQQEKSLERILEMTKRFYVEQKMNQLANKLEDLAKKQEELAKKDATKEEQEKLNDEFKKAQKELNELQKENSKLKEPMDVPSMKELQKEAEKEQQEASKNLEQQNKEGAKKNQKKSAKKMKEMSQKMQETMQMMSQQMQEENKQDLRQILENLVTFSFEQEDLMKSINGTSASHPNFSKNLKKQYQLKTYFNHIDDSIYMLSIRVPKLTTEVQDLLGNAHYNLDQSLENFAENRFSSGVSNQRYVMTSTNTIADMLSNFLNAMNNPKPGSGSGGKGSGKSFSLPDIIQKQEDLIKKMQDGMKKGEQGKPKDGKKGKDGKPKKGENGKPGQGGEGEKMNGELYEIYKEQSKLRQQLQDAIKQGGEGAGEAKKALKKMEQLENEILDKGFTQGTLERMQKMNYELLKLDKATFEQGKEKKRKANTNLQEFEKNKAKQLKFKKLFYNQTEILNRQSLPLRQNYKKKVQEYFSVPVEKEK